MDINGKDPHIINNNSVEKAIVELTVSIESNAANWETVMERGKLYWKIGRIKCALQDFILADKLHPDSTPAELLRHSLEILKFRNTDLLNP